MYLKGSKHFAFHLIHINDTTEQYLLLEIKKIKNKMIKEIGHIRPMNIYCVHDK